jgi:hypothetical protein
MIKVCPQCLSVLGICDPRDNPGIKNVMCEDCRPPRPIITPIMAYHTGEGLHGNEAQGVIAA